jgi:dihydroorotate dehydrogenase (NAD+) catalytic subunit
MDKLNVNIGKLKLKNPVMVASGTFGYAEEFSSFMNLKKLGAIVTKTITLQPRAGNPVPRTCETPSGMLNSIGLENPGIKIFLREKLPLLKKIGVPVIVSIASEGDPGEFIMLARELNKTEGVAAIELNISCPNIREKSKLVSQDAELTYDLVKTVRKATTKTLITKLSPNVTDIAQIALAAEAAGSDALALINTLVGMSIDVNTRRSRLASAAGGLSGPAIRPVAVRMVWDCYQKIRIPIIGMGGIIDTLSALEFILAGACAVSVGTANFVDPETVVRIIDGLKDYLKKNKLGNIREMTGALNT